MKKHRPFLIGLTGSIGMGKSTTAQMFADQNIPVWDADRVVETLYSAGGAAVEPMSAFYPSCVIDGAIDRNALREVISTDSKALSAIEAFVHPLVKADRKEFITNTVSDIVVLDIPLLFETGSDKQMDLVVVVSVNADEQRKRVLERPNITEKQFELMVAKQMPDIEKRRLADVVIMTNTLESTRAGVAELIAKIRGRLANA